MDCTVGNPDAVVEQPGHLGRGLEDCSGGSSLGCSLGLVLVPSAGILLPENCPRKILTLGEQSEVMARYLLRAEAVNFRVELQQRADLEHDPRRLHADDECEASSRDFLPGLQSRGLRGIAGGLVVQGLR